MPATILSSTPSKTSGQPALLQAPVFSQAPNVNAGLIQPREVNAPNLPTIINQGLSLNTPAFDGLAQTILRKADKEAEELDTAEALTIAEAKAEQMRAIRMRAMNSSGKEFLNGMSDSLGDLQKIYADSIKHARPNVAKKLVAILTPQYYDERQKFAELNLKESEQAKQDGIAANTRMTSSKAVDNRYDINRFTTGYVESMNQIDMIYAGNPAQAAAEKAKLGSVLFTDVVGALAADNATVLTNPHVPEKARVSTSRTTISQMVQLRDLAMTAGLGAEVFLMPKRGSKLT